MNHSSSCSMIAVNSLCIASVRISASLRDPGREVTRSDTLAERQACSGRATEHRNYDKHSARALRCTPLLDGVTASPRLEYSPLCLSQARALRPTPFEDCCALRCIVSCELLGCALCRSAFRIVSDDQAATWRSTVSGPCASRSAPRRGRSPPSPLFRNPGFPAPLRDPPPADWLEPHRPRRAQS